jgi:AbrB family looped-hinge helix DNA binding protein
MRVTSKGQVTIPIEIRQRFGIDEETEVEFQVVGDVVQLRKISSGPARGRRVVGRLLEAPYVGPSTDELLALTRGEE